MYDESQDSENVLFLEMCGCIRLCGLQMWNVDRRTSDHFAECSSCLSIDMCNMQYLFITHLIRLWNMYVTVRISLKNKYINKIIKFCSPTLIL